MLEAVEQVPTSSFKVNGQGTGSAQCHPRTILAVLICCYANREKLEGEWALVTLAYKCKRFNNTRMA